MTPVQYLQFLFPAFETLEEEAVATALEIAADYIPACLTESKQNEAQALYAAYLLEQRVNREAGASTSLPAGPLIQEKEGQLERRYADTTMLGTGYVDTSFYGRWKVLNDVCTFGAIVTRFG